MALDYTSDAITNLKTSPPPTPHSAGEVYAIPFYVYLDDEVTTSDLIGLAPLPPDCLPIGITQVVSDLDEGTALVYDVAILNDDKDDIVANSDFISGSTTGQAGGTERLSSDEILDPATWLAETDCPEAHEWKYVAAKVTTPATTATTGTIRGILTFRAARNGV